MRTNNYTEEELNALVGMTRKEVNEYFIEKGETEIENDDEAMYIGNYWSDDCISIEFDYIENENGEEKEIVENAFYNGAWE